MCEAAMPEGSPLLYPSGLPYQPETRHDSWRHCGCVPGEWVTLASKRAGVRGAVKHLETHKALQPLLQALSC